MTAKRNDALGRRDMLAATVRAGCAALLAGGLLGLPGRRPAEATALRPPGALAEGAFLGACLRCALCAGACPYRALRAAGIGDGPAPGTPYFVARETPCEMCEDIPCVGACPSGALSRALTDITEARMGLAVLTGAGTCLNYQGLRCDVCYRTCPRIDAAITLEAHHNERTGRHAVFIPTVHADQCTGCGKCEKACVLDRPAIQVLSLERARGASDAHYRLGWEEKAKAGRPLVEGIIELPRHQPDGGR